MVHLIVSSCVFLLVNSLFQVEILGDPKSNLEIRNQVRVSEILDVFDVEGSIDDEISLPEINSDAPLVEISTLGKVQGIGGETEWTRQKFFQFLSIPYGESTSGRRRFKPPEPKKPWRNVLLANEEKLGCPSGTFGILEDDNYDMEDCLHLSVYTKNLTGLFPVMVVLSGEMFFESQIRNRHPPHYLMEKDIVLVVPEFRLGIFGFLSTNREIPGNVGALDGVLALKWVHDYIQYFGGDKDHVTLVGQSSGAVIAHAISLSPLVPKNLFHQIILQSGTALAPNIINRNPVKHATDLAEYFGCSNLTNIFDINSCFLNQTSKNLIINSTLMSINNESELPDNLGVKLTINDFNGFLPDSPINLARDTNSKKYPMMAGVTKQDGMFAFDDFYVTLANYPHKHEKLYISYHLIDEFLQKCGIDDQSGSIKNLARTRLFSQSDLKDGNFPKLLPGFVDLASIVLVKSPIWETVQINRQNATTFLYSFDYKGRHTRFGYGDSKADSPYLGGVCHRDENIYLFPFPTYAKTLFGKDLLMSKMMVNMWTSFVIDGIPSAEKAPTWTTVSDFNGPYMKIKSDPHLGDSFLDEFFISTTEQEFANLHNTTGLISKDKIDNFFMHHKSSGQ